MAGRLRSLLPTIGIGVLPALVAASLLAACDRRDDDGPVVVSVIGQAADLTLPVTYGPAAPRRLLLDAVAQGLVQFDANGQIEPGLAARWIVAADGLSYIFRLRQATWANGREVDAEEVARILTQRLSPRTDNPLAPYLTAIVSIVAMTPEVIEITLTRPRPDLLTLLAQPEMAVVGAPRQMGAGPLRAQPAAPGLMLTPIADPLDTQGDAPPDGAEANRRIRLTAEPAGRAIVRFGAGQADLVAGGDFTSWPLLGAADVPRDRIRLETLPGLFGFALSRDGFLAEAADRAIVAGVIDRAAMTRAIAPEWQSSATILPDRLDSAAAPSGFDTDAIPIEDRRLRARARAAEWRGETGSVPVLRVALPTGPGATIVWGRIAADLIAAGFAVERVALDAPADLRLVDQVAPFDSARWYLRTACGTCAPLVRDALEAARLAPNAGLRAQANAIADAAIVRDVAFIPIARPIRWSLVAPRLGNWQANARGWHPLNQLREMPR